MTTSGQQDRLDTDAGAANRAFADEYRRNHAAVFGYLRARLLNASDADDLCQEVFLRAYGARGRYDPSSDIRPWLIGIGRNVLREHVRRLRRRKEVTWTEMCLDLEQAAEADGCYQDVLHLLPICVVRLGDSARRAIQWHYMHGLRLAQVAERLDKTVGAVKVLMVRARQALKRCIQSQTTGEAS